MSQRVVWYSVVRAEELSGLVGAVNERIEQGWQPVGAMQVDNTQRMHFFQTMVKYNEEEESSS